MSTSPTPKGTPVQRSPSDGVPESLQSPQHSTPGSGPQHKKRISSLLQSPVRWLRVCVCRIYCLNLFPLSFSASSLDVVISSHYNKSVLKCHLTAWAAVSAGAHSECMTMCVPAYGRATVMRVKWGEGEHEVKELMERG